jgi:hypothetical protein
MKKTLLRAFTILFLTACGAQGNVPGPSNSQYGLIHPQISLITHTCPGGRCQGKKH